MARRPCLGPDLDSPCPTRALVHGPRCQSCAWHWQRRKDARRPERRTYAEQERRREQVRAQPWCTVCGAITDLTAGHLQDVAVTGREDGPLMTLCRHHNSSSGATVRRADLR